jgi:hypothetical protein
VRYQVKSNVSEVYRITKLTFGTYVHSSAAHLSNHVFNIQTSASFVSHDTCYFSNLALISVIPKLSLITLVVISESHQSPMRRAGTYKMRNSLHISCPFLLGVLLYYEHTGLYLTVFVPRPWHGTWLSQGITFICATVAAYIGVQLNVEPVTILYHRSSMK